MYPYVTSKDEKSGLWYAHKAGYSWIPCFGSFGSKQHATNAAAGEMGLTAKEYQQYKQAHPKLFTREGYLKFINDRFPVTVGYATLKSR